MLRTTTLLVTATLCASSAAWAGDTTAKPTPTAAAAPEAKNATAPEAKKKMSDSPYGSGPPAVTGGFTDTWQGGKKTSGAIPGVGGNAADPDMKLGK